MNYYKIGLILTGVLMLLTEVQDGTQTLIAIVLIYIIGRVRSSVAHKSAMVTMQQRRRLEYRAARRHYQRVRIQGYVSPIELAKSSFPNYTPERINRITLAEILSGK